MKPNSIPSAGTNAEQKTDVEYTSVSPFFAKPNVIGSLLKVHLSDFFKKEDLIDFVELVDNHKEEFKSFCKQVRQAGVEDELDSNIHLLGKQIDFLISRGYLSNCL